MLNWPVIVPGGTVARSCVGESIVKLTTPPLLNSMMLVAFRLVPVMVTTVPIGPEVGVKLVMVGVPVAPTVTVAEALALPPVPVQVRVYVEVEVRLPVDWEPEVALLPDQAPDALHDVALVELQVSVEAEPEDTDVGEAVKETVGVVPPLPVVYSSAPASQAVPWGRDWPSKSV